MNTHIKIHTTEDGSPTASHAQFDHEKMHHVGGALLESIYVYSPVIKWALEKSLHPKILSIGLGLGYLELLIATYLLVENEPRKKGLADEFYMESFESDTDLADEFLDWVKGKSGSSTVYDEMLRQIEERFDVSGEDVRELLNEAYENHSWVVRPTLGLRTDFKNTFDVIMYDLYSANVMGEYWDERFLQPFISKVASPSCGFATHTAKTSLKHALKDNNFNVVDRPGFQNKRESTLAFR